MPLYISLPIGSRLGLHPHLLCIIKVSLGIAVHHMAGGYTPLESDADQDRALRERGAGVRL